MQAQGLCISTWYGLKQEDKVDTSWVPPCWIRASSEDVIYPWSHRALVRIPMQS